MYFFPDNARDLVYFVGMSLLGFLSVMCTSKPLKEVGLRQNKIKGLDKDFRKYLSMFSKAPFLLSKKKKMQLHFLQPPQDFCHGCKWQTKGKRRARSPGRMPIGANARPAVCLLGHYSSAKQLPAAALTPVPVLLHQNLA